MGSNILNNCCVQRATNFSHHIVQRNWTRVASPQEGFNLKVLHWNILADKLAKNFPKVPEEYLLWEYRFEMIKQHILQVNPDVFGLSELDLPPLYADVVDAFGKLGYHNYFVAKSNKISGSAIFYKKDLFDLVQQDSF